ncbi:MAG: signal peptidase II [Candidatus Stahlbacteria bacterium]|nr:MAG: signal peptidase II [Candidatus Stahlbacteria bacterium]
MIFKRHIKLLVIFIIGTFLIDQISKILIVNFLTPLDPPVVNVISSLLRFKLTYNPYGVFSISLGPNILYYIFSIIGIFILIYIGLSLKDKTSVVVFGIIIGGALGNIFDRLRLDYVIDFIDMGIGNLRWFTYNFADACITVGAIFLLMRGLFSKKKKDTETT